jgi:hypothetical protein
VNYAVSDPGTNIHAALNLIHGPPHVPTPAGKHDAVIESKIRRIKENARAIQASLPFKLDAKLLIWLIQYSVYVSNLMPGPYPGISPREALTGRKPEYSKALPFAFGDFVQISQRYPDNTMAPRTFAAMAVLPDGNGSGHFLPLGSGDSVYSNAFHTLPWSEDYLSIVQRMLKDPISSELDFSHIPNKPSRNRRITLRMPEQAPSIDTNLRPVAPTATDGHEYDDMLFADDVIESMGDDPTPTPTTEPTEEETLLKDEEVTNALYTCDTDSDGESTSIRAYNLTISQAVEKRGVKDTNLSLKRELKQMVDRKVIVGVLPEEAKKIPKRDILPSKIFLKEKKDTITGVYVELKSRLVGGGHRQDRSLLTYEETSSPTASPTSLFLVGSIAAKEKRVMMAHDFPGAYLHARRPKEMKRIFMRLGPVLATLIIEICPSYKQFQLPDGSIVTEILAALYGLIESGLLWYKEISDFLISIGFVKNRFDQCVFYHPDNQLHIVIYVDDLFVTGHHQKDLDWLSASLEGKYGSTTKRTGDIIAF